MSLTMSQFILEMACRLRCIRVIAESADKWVGKVEATFPNEE